MYTQMHIERRLPGSMTLSGEEVRKHNFNGIDIGSQVKKKQTADYLLRNGESLICPALSTWTAYQSGDIGFSSLAGHKPLTVPVARPTG